MEENYKDILRKSMLLLASVTHDLNNVAKKLLSEIGDIKVLGRFVKPSELLIFATTNNNVEMVKLLHEHHGGDVNTTDRFGFTPLMISCRNMNYDLVEYFLSNGALINTLQKRTELAAIHVCVQNIQDPRTFERFLQLFLSYKLDLDDEVNIILVYSVYMKRYDATIELIVNGADVNKLLDTSNVFMFPDNYSSLLLIDVPNAVLHLFVLAGLNVNKLLSLISWFENDRRRKFLESFKNKALKLQDLCRIKIRNSLGRDPLKKIKELPLPSSIKDYLSFDYL